MNESSIAVDSNSNVFFADTNTHRTRKINPAGIITTVAGVVNTCCFNSDNIQATSAQLNNPRSVAVDGAGNLLITDSNNGRIRKVGTDGIITTVAGAGSNYPGDGSAATAASLRTPGAAIWDPSGA